jgi:hypothetical protein
MVADPTFTVGFVYSLSSEGQTTVPYVGVDYAAIGLWGGPVLAGTEFELPLNWTSNIRPTGGVKFFVQRNIAFDINVGWDKDLGENAGERNTFDSRVGFSYVF